MRTRLPPFFTLQAFEAAARHGSFSRAALELHITPSAVSRQIRQLEDWSQLVLFERHGPRVQLTADGHRLLARLQAPLDGLHSALRPDQTSQQYPLQICTLASFAKAWLVPRLPSFHAGNPDISITVQTDYELVRLPPRLPIMAIRYGALPDPANRSELLFGDRIVTVATSRTLLELGSEPSAWPAQRLLRHTTGDWQVWWDALGIREAPVASGYAYNDADVLLDACENDLGIALTRMSLAAPRVASGRLVSAHPLQCASAFRYYLIYRSDAAENTAVRRFRDWLVAQASDDPLTAIDSSAPASVVACPRRLG